MTTHLTPLQVCERLFGSVEDVARAAGTHPKRGYVWRHSSKWADAGDFRSLRHVRALHAHARAKGIPVTLEHLIYGASEDAVAAIEAGQRACAPPVVEAAE